MNSDTPILILMKEKTESVEQTNALKRFKQSLDIMKLSITVTRLSRKLLT